MTLDELEAEHIRRVLAVGAVARRGRRASSASTRARCTASGSGTGRAERGLHDPPPPHPADARPARSLLLAVLGRRRRRAARPRLGGADRRDPARELRQRPGHVPAERGAGADRLVVPVRPGRPGGRRPRSSSRRTGRRSTSSSQIEREQRHHPPGRGRAGRAAASDSTADYRERGERFFARPPAVAGAAGDYFGAAGDPGLLGQFREIKDGVRRDPADQPGEHGAGQPTRPGPPPGRSLVGVRRRPGASPRCSVGRRRLVPAADHPRPDPGRHRRRPRPIGDGPPRPDRAGASGATNSASWPRRSTP